VVFEKGGRGKGVHITACCHCLLREGDANKMHAKTEDRQQDELTAGHCCWFPPTLCFPSGSKHQVLTDPTHV